MQSNTASIANPLRAMKEQKNLERIPDHQPADSERAFKGALIWIGIAGLGLAVTAVAARALFFRRQSDPTGQRIQALIDEANSLLRTLDDQRNSA